MPQERRASDQQVAAVLVDGVVLVDAVLRPFERRNRHALDGLGDAGIEVVFDAEQRVDQRRVADGQPIRQPVMLIALRERVELDADVAGAFSLEEAHGLIAVVGDLAVGPVVADGDVVLLGEAHCLLEEGRGRRRRRSGCWGS